MPLVTRAEFKRQNDIIQEAKKKIRRQDRAAAAVAKSLIAQNPEETNEIPDEELED